MNPVKLAFARSWRVLVAYGAFTAWGLACLCASVLLIMGTKAVPAISPSLVLTLAGICGAAIAGHFTGNVLALLRLRLWVIAVLGMFVALGLLIASAVMGPSSGFLVVGALAALGGYFGVASRMEIFAAWLPLTYAVGAAVLWMNNQGKVSVWLTGAKFAVWDAVTFAFLTGAVLLFLVFLMTRHALALTLWADAAKPGARTVEIRAKAGRGSLLALVAFSGVVLLATAVISPFLFRSEVEHTTVVVNGHVTHPNTYTVTTSHKPPQYAYGNAYNNSGTYNYGYAHNNSGTVYNGNGYGYGSGGAGGGCGGAGGTPVANPPPNVAVDSATTTKKIEPQTPPTPNPDDGCDPDKNATALLNPACFNKLKTAKTTVKKNVTSGTGSPTIVMDGQVVNPDGTITKYEHGVAVGVGTGVGTGVAGVGYGNGYGYGNGGAGYGGNGAGGNGGVGAYGANRNGSNGSNGYGAGGYGGNGGYAGNGGGVHTSNGAAAGGVAAGGAAGGAAAGGAPAGGAAAGGAAAGGAAVGGTASGATGGANAAGGAAANGAAAIPGEEMPSSGDIEESDGSVPEPNMDDVREHGAHAAMIGLGVVGWLVVLLAMILTLAVFFRPIRRALLLKHLERPLWKTTPTRRVENLWLRALIALDDMGIRMQSDETPEKLAKRVAEEMAQQKGERPAGIEAAAKIVERLEYAGRGLSPDEEGKMRAAVQSLLAYFSRHMSAGKKLALAWATVRAR